MSTFHTVTGSFPKWNDFELSLHLNLALDVVAKTWSHSWPGRPNVQTKTFWTLFHFYSNEEYRYSMSPFFILGNTMRDLRETLAAILSSNDRKDYPLVGPINLNIIYFINPKIKCYVFVLFWHFNLFWHANNVYARSAYVVSLTSHNYHYMIPAFHSLQYIYGI